MLGDHSYRYLTADEMKSLGDDSLPIDVTRDERIDSNKMVISEEQNILPPQAIEDGISPQYITENYVEYTKKYIPDNVDIARHPINIGFLVSFLVDARGGAMRGCRHSGVRVIVPPRCAPSPTRITCRYVRPQRTPHPPPLMEGEALASRVLELGPVGAKFLGPVIIEVPHFAALRGKEREIVILRSDNGETWREHTIEASEDILNDVLNDSFEADDLSQLDDVSSGRITRILTHDFPQYFAVVSRIRQEVHAIGPEGGMVSSTVVPQVQAVFPQGALTKKIKVGLQAQPIDPELTAKLLGHGVAVSPVVTVEPRRRKFHKAITLSMPAPRAHSQGMINQYSGSAPTLRLLCSITGGTTRAQWEDVTGSTPLTFVNDCVSFTTTVSARFWLMDCRNIGDATKMATELYREAIHVPFMAKFVVFAKRIDPLEARLRVFCMTDDKEDKTLEHQEHFTEVAKSRDVEVLEGKPQYIEFAGNLVPITKSGEPLQFSLRAFRENRLPFSVRVKDQHAEAVGRSLFMREPKVAKGEPPQQPICILNIVLPDDIVSETISLTDNESIKRHVFLKDNFEYYRPDPRLADMSNLLGENWVPLATQLGLTPSEINVIKSEYPDSVAKQAQSMLRMWISQSGNKAQGDALENALKRIGREDIIPQCLNVDDVDRIPKIPREVIDRYQINKAMDTIPYTTDEVSQNEIIKSSETYESKYSAEEKAIDEPCDQEEDFNKSVSERRQQIEKRLTEQSIPASAQRQEIVEEITTIKRQSIVEDKISEVKDKHIVDPAKPTTTKPVSISTDTETVTTETVKTTKPPVFPVTQSKVEETKKSEKITETRTYEHMPTNEITKHALTSDFISRERRDSDLLDGVTQILETTKKAVPRISTGEDPNSPKFSKTPPPSPADFIYREQAAAVQEWNAHDRLPKDKSSAASEAAIIESAASPGKSTTTPIHLASSEELSLESPKVDKRPLNDLYDVNLLTNAFINHESLPEPYNALTEQSVQKERASRKKSIEEEKPSRDSSREDTSKEEKRTKKGFFGTLKNIVGKSQERSDSESEKSLKKEKKTKKKEKKKSVPKLPPTIPDRPPRKPKLPTPTEERPEFANIPFVEASADDSIRVQTTDLDVETSLPETIKNHANEIVSEVIATSENTASDIIENGKIKDATKVTIAQEIKKTFEPKIYERGEYRIVVTPTSQRKPKEYFTSNIEDATSSPTDQTVPIRPQRKKEHVYEDIDEPNVSERRLFDSSNISDDVKTETTRLIQNEMYFSGWADDKHNVHKPTVHETKDQTQKLTKKHGKLFGFLAKKSSKDVDESDEESKKEIIEKQDREPSKERKLKPQKTDSFSEDDEQKKGGFLGIFGKKIKKEDDHTEDKREPETQVAESTVVQSTTTVTKEPRLSRVVIGDMKATENFLSKEVHFFEDVKPRTTSVADITVGVEKDPELTEIAHDDKVKIKKDKHRRKKKEKKVLSESEDESESRKSGFFGFFGKKTKKEQKTTTKDEEKEPAVPTGSLSEAVLRAMGDSRDFLKDEIVHFEDVMPIKAQTPVEKGPPTIKEEINKLESPVPISDEAGTKSPEEARINTAKFLDEEVNNFEDVIQRVVHETPVKVQKVDLDDKKKKSKKAKKEREGSASGDDSDAGRRSGFFGIFGRKTAKSQEKELIAEKQSKETTEFSNKPVCEKGSESIQISIADTANFSNDEVTHFEDVQRRMVPGKPLKAVDVRLDDAKNVKSVGEKRDGLVVGKEITESSKDDSTKKADVEAIIIIVDTANFLNNEITHFEDVKQRMVQEAPLKAVKVTLDDVKKKKPLAEKGKEKDQVAAEQLKKSSKNFSTKQPSAEAIISITDTANFLNDEITHFDDVKQRMVQKKLSKTVKVTFDDEIKIKPLAEKDKEKKLIAAKPTKEPSKDVSTRKTGAETIINITDTVNFLNDEVKHFADVEQCTIQENHLKALKLSLDDEKKIAEKPEKDLFAVKQIKESSEDISTKQPNAEAIIIITNTSNFLNDEVRYFEDVKQSIVQEKLLKAVTLDDEKKMKALAEKGLDLIAVKQIKESFKDSSTKKPSAEAIISINDTVNFLNDEVTHFEDVKQRVVREEPLKAVKVTLDDTKKKPVTEKPDIPDKVHKKSKQKDEKKDTPIEDNTKLIQMTTSFLQKEVTELDDVLPMKTQKERTSEAIIPVKGQNGDSAQVKQTPKKKDDLTEEKHEVKVFRDESTTTPQKMSDDDIKRIAATEKFLGAEIANFDDVKFIEQLKQQTRETIKPIGIKPAEAIFPKNEESPDEVEEAISNMANCVSFLNDEIRYFEDVRPVVRYDEIKSEKVDKDKRESSTSDDESETKKRGIFGIFGKKGKKDKIKSKTGKPNTEESVTKYADLLLKKDEEIEKAHKHEQSTIEKSEEKTQASSKTKPDEHNEKALRNMINCGHFLTDEIQNFEDVKQVKKEEDQIIKVLAVKDKQEIKAAEGFKTDPSDILKQIDDTTNFLQAEITNFEDVMLVKSVKKGTKEKSQIDSSVEPNWEITKNVTDEFLNDEIEHFDDVKPAPVRHITYQSIDSDTIKKKKKKTKKTKGSKEVNVDSGDESDGSKTSGFLGIFGKKAKKDKPELATNEDENVTLKNVTLSDSNLKDVEGVKLECEMDKKIETDLQLKKTKKQEQESESKPGRLFGIFGKKEKKQTGDSAKPQEIAEKIPDDKLKDTPETVQSLADEIIHFEDVIPVVIQEVDKLEIETPDYQIMKTEENSSIPKSIVQTKTTIITTIFEESAPKSTVMSTETHFLSKTPQITTDDHQNGEVITIHKDSPKTLKSLAEAEFFLKEEIEEYHDVKEIQTTSLTIEPIEHSDSESQDISKSGFFGLFGKKEHKSQEETTLDTSAEIEESKTDTIKPQESEFIDATGNFLQNELDNYQDSKWNVAHSNVETSPVTEEEPKYKKGKGLFGLFAKKSEDEDSSEKHTEKESNERKKSGSPFRIFTKRGKSEEKQTVEKPSPSEQTLRSIQDTKTFMNTEVTRFDDIMSEADQLLRSQKESESKDTEIVQKLETELNDLNDWLVVEKQHIEERLKSTENATKPDLSQFGDKTGKFVKSVEQKIDDVKDSTEEKIKQSKQAVKSMQESAETEVTQTGNRLMEITETTGEDIDIFCKNAEDSLPTIKESSQKTAKKSGGFFMKLGDKLSGKVKEVDDEKEKTTGAEVSITTDDGYHFVPKISKNLDDEIKQPVVEIIDGAKDTVEKYTHKSGGFLTKIGGKITGKTKEAKEIVDKVQERTTEKIQDTTAKLSGTGEEIKDGLISTTEATTFQMEDIAQDVTEKINANKVDIQKEIKKADDWVDENVQLIKDNKTKTEQVAAQLVQEVGSKVCEAEFDAMDKITHTKKRKIDGASDSAAKLISDTRESFGLIRTNVESDISIKKMEIKSTIGDTQEKIQQCREGIDVEKTTEEIAVKSDAFLKKIDDNSKDAKKQIQEFKDKSKEMAKDAAVKTMDACKQIEKGVASAEIDAEAKVETARKVVTERIGEIKVDTQSKLKGITEAKLVETKRDIQEKMDESCNWLSKENEQLQSTISDRKYGAKDMLDRAQKVIVEESEAVKDEIKLSTTSSIQETSSSLSETIKDTSDNIKEGLHDVMEKSTEEKKRKKSDFFSKLSDKLSEKSKDTKDSSESPKDEAKTIIEDTRAFLDSEAIPIQSSVAELKDDFKLETEKIEISTNGTKAPINESLDHTKDVIGDKFTQFGSEAKRLETSKKAELKDTVLETHNWELISKEDLKGQPHGDIMVEYLSDVVHSTPIAQDRTVITEESTKEDSIKTEDKIGETIPMKIDKAEIKGKQKTVHKIVNPVTEGVVQQKSDLLIPDIKFDVQTKLDSSDFIKNEKVAEMKSSQKLDLIKNESVKILKEELDKMKSEEEVLEKDLISGVENKGKQTIDEEVDTLKQSGKPAGVLVQTDSKKLPMVISPTLPRRAASQSIPMGEVPYFVDVSNLPHDDSSDDESYIVTEPTDKISVPTQNSYDLHSKRKPLFHMDSEESSGCSGSKRGSINLHEKKSPDKEILSTDILLTDDMKEKDEKYQLDKLKVFDDSIHRTKQISEIKFLRECETHTEVPFIEKASVEDIDEKIVSQVYELKAASLDENQQSIEETDKNDLSKERRLHETEIYILSSDEEYSSQSARMMQDNVIRTSEYCDKLKFSKVEMVKVLQSLIEEESLEHLHKDVPSVDSTDRSEMSKSVEVLHDVEKDAYDEQVIGRRKSSTDVVRSDTEEKLSHRSETYEDYMTSDEFSQISSVHYSDSNKLSETDAEPVSSETESSYKLEIHTMSEISDVSTKRSIHSPVYEVESPHTDVTEYSGSHAESIIDTSQIEIKSQNGVSTEIEYRIDAKDITMQGDLLEVTMHGGLSTEQKYIFEEATQELKPISPIRQRKSTKKIVEQKDTSVISNKHTTAKLENEVVIRKKDGLDMKNLNGDVKSLKFTEREDVSTIRRHIVGKYDIRTKYDYKTRKAAKKVTTASTTKSTTSPIRSLHSPKPKATKLCSDADISSDDEKTKTKTFREKVFKKTQSTKSSSAYEVTNVKTQIPRLVKSPLRKVYSSDSTSTDTTSTISKKYETKKRSKYSTVTPPEPYKPQHVVHGYMQSTVSRDMKIERNVVQTKCVTSYKSKDNKETENVNAKTKQTKRSDTTEKKSEHVRHTYERRTVSSEKKSSRESTPIKSTKIKNVSETCNVTAKVDSKERKSRVDSVSRYVHTTTRKDTPSGTNSKDLYGKRIVTRESKAQHEMIPRIESPKPSPSPTKLRRTEPVEDHIRKVSLSEKILSKPSCKPSEIDKTVHLSDNSRSQSVIPTTYHDSTQEQLTERTPSATSLPESPIRVRSANGGSKVLTSEVFTRSHDRAGSIEVIYKQPYDNLKRVASSIREAEFSLIDTTDSSLSESVALPSSPSDHDMSSDANGRNKASSPSSPKRSLESIHELKHRVSDLVSCALIPEDDKFTLEDEEAWIDLPRKLLMESSQQSVQAEISKAVAESSVQEIREVLMKSSKHRMTEWNAHDRLPKDESSAASEAAIIESAASPETGSAQLTKPPIELTSETKQLTTIPKPKPRANKSPDSQLQITTPPQKPDQSLQISPVRDDTLDVEEESGSPPDSYSDKKKFWESVTKEQTPLAVQKRRSLFEETSTEKVSLKKRTSIHEVSVAPPVPKPRIGLQTSQSINEIPDEEHEDTKEKTHEENKRSVFKTEYQSSYVDHTQSPPKTVETAIEKGGSFESENDESSGNNQSAGCENTGYISDSGDVEHYISDSEIEDRVPQIRERQMSVFHPSMSSTRKNIYERSLSLPTEDLYELSAKNILSKKQYYEEQIRKEMVEKQLMTELEEESSPERKALACLTIEEEEPSGIRSAPEKDSTTDLAEAFGATVKALEKDKSAATDVQGERRSVKDLAKSFETESGSCILSQKVMPVKLAKTTKKEDLDDTLEKIDSKYEDGSHTKPENAMFIERIESIFESHKLIEESVDETTTDVTMHDFETSEELGSKEIDETSVKKMEPTKEPIRRTLSSEIKTQSTDIKEDFSERSEESKLTYASDIEKDEKSEIVSTKFVQDSNADADRREFVKHVRSIEMESELDDLSELEKSDTSRITYASDIDKSEEIQQNKFKKTNGYNEDDQKVTTSTQKTPFILFEEKDADTVEIAHKTDFTQKLADQTEITHKLDVDTSKIEANLLDKAPDLTHKPDATHTSDELRPAQLANITEVTTKTRTLQTHKSQDQTPISQTHKTHKEIDIGPRGQQSSTDSEQSVFSERSSELELVDLLDDTTKDQYAKPEDSMEVHVDKSEIEDLEKLTDLDQDIETKSVDSLNAIEMSPKSSFNADEHIPEITISLSGIQRRISEESEESLEKPVEQKSTSPIHQPEEHVQNVLWEVSIESHPQDIFQESATDLHLEKQAFLEKDDELSSSVHDESDLGSEIHQDHSESYSSDKQKSESHSEIEKLLLESLQQQKISHDEAQIIASELLADIEAEIQKRHTLDVEIGEPPAPEVAQNEVSEYLRQLAETKGLDSREVELVQSVLARKQRQLCKLSRGDTQASSMEITDEDLRYSGTDVDYSPSASRAHILEEQIDHLEAEKALERKYSREFDISFAEKIYDSRLKESSIKKDYESLADGKHSSIKAEIDTKLLETLSGEKTFMEKKNAIVEEDETLTESLSEESTNIQMKTDICTIETEDKITDDTAFSKKDSCFVTEDTSTKSDVKTKSYEIIGTDFSKELTQTEEKEIEVSNKFGALKSQEEVYESTPEGTVSKTIITSQEVEESMTVESDSKSDQVEEIKTSKNLESKISEVTIHKKISCSSTVVDCSHEESKTVSSQILGEILEADLDDLILKGKLTLAEEKCDTMKPIIADDRDELKQTSSDESKSSMEETKSHELISTSSSEKKDADLKPEVVFRKVKVRDGDTSSSSSIIKPDRKSGIDFEAYSSSGESHYQSFELDSGKSRPCSSDVEGLLAAGSSEYESALTSQDISATTHLTSYHTAVSSLSSKESMKSLDSESSGNLASVEVSEASETLVASEYELGEADTNLDDSLDRVQLPKRQSTELSDSELVYPGIDESVDVSEEDVDMKDIEDTPSKMKRSYEMTFQPEPKVLVPDSPHSEIVQGMDDRFCTSLDEGSVLSVSLSSTSSVTALRTVIEASHVGSERQEGGVIAGVGSSDNTENLPQSMESSTSTQAHGQDFPLESVTMITSTIAENGIQNVSTQVTSRAHTPDNRLQDEALQSKTKDELNEPFDPKRRGHRRYESTSAFPIPVSISTQIERKLHSDLAESDKYTTQLSVKEGRSDEKKDVDETEKEECYETEADQGFQRDLREGRYSETVYDGYGKENVESDRERLTSTATDERPDSELAELEKQYSSDVMSDPIERPVTPEPCDECEIKDDTPEFSSEAQASVGELEQEYTSAVARSQEVHTMEIKKQILSEVSGEKPAHKDIFDKRDSHGKLSSTSSEKSSFEEAEAEAAFSMVAHVSPAHKVKQICPILEDEDAEKHELETRERAQKEFEKRRSQQKDQSPGAIPDIKVTQHMAPLIDRGFRYPDLELEEKDDEQQKSTPQTPASSKSSESTDQGQEYNLEESSVTVLDQSTSDDKALTESRSDVGTVVEKTIYETDKETESPNSDSFELLEKPDLIDDFVVIEEVAKEAHELDMEGKSVKIASKKYTKKHDQEIEEYLVKSVAATSTKMTNVKDYPNGSSSDELGFEFEDSPPQPDEKNAGVSTKSPRDYVYEYDRELEANRKWIEEQFQGNQAAMMAADYGYEMEFERGPLEDIKEEDITDIESRIGSLSSQKGSGGSLGSVKDSYSSTPEYDVLAGRKYFTRSGEHDDLSMSSLQEFENLERAMSLENRRCFASSQESSSNGSFKNRYIASKSGQGDDVSVSSLKEFEGLEKACIAVHKIELKAKEEEAMLSQIDEGQESIASETESCETISGTDKKLIPDSDEEDYEKRMFEIDEIIRQAQTNVERFIEGEKTESLGRGDSFEEVAKVPDLDLDAPLIRTSTKIQWAETDDVMATSTDSLDLQPEKPSYHDSTDSLDQKTAGDIMTASTDSIEFQVQKSTNIMTDSIDIKDGERSGMITSDSLELPGSNAQFVTSDSIDEDGSRIGGHDQSSSSTGKDVSSSAKDDVAESKLAGEFVFDADSIASTSTATHATYQYETDSVISGSFTSGGSNTMVSSTDTIDPIGSHIREAVDLAAAVRKVWFDDSEGASKKFTTECIEDGSKPYVTEVIVPSEDDDMYSHTIHRRVQLPPEVEKITFSGSDADQQMRQFVENFGEGEDVQESEEIDADGNVHIKRVVQKRFVIKTDQQGDEQRISGPEIQQFFQQFEQKPVEFDDRFTKQSRQEVRTIREERLQQQDPVIHSVLTSIAGDPTGEASGSQQQRTDPIAEQTTTFIRAQGTRRRPLRYEISIDDQTEVDPREHDWRFNLTQHAEAEESGREAAGQELPHRSVADQHQLSEEMKALLKQMEDESKK